MEQFLRDNGLVAGLALLVVVTGAGLFLAAQAAAGVRRFREDHHESFVNRDSGGDK